MRLIPIATLCLALTACGTPTPEPADPVPDPQAAAPAQEPTALRRAIEEPLDKAHAVEAADAERDAERQRALEEAGG